MKTRSLLYMILAAAALLPASAEAAKRKTASRKPTAPELMAQARDAFYAYNPDLASEKIAEIRKLKKGFDADSLDMLEDKVNRLDEMIQRVQDIVVIDSIAVDRGDFFRHYRLEPSSGFLASPAELGEGFEAADSTVVYIPQDGSRMIWGTSRGLVQSRRLTDGSWEDPTELGEVLNNGGTANYPFVLSDGVTIYYATDGDDSLGGLDIYMSRSDREEYAMPQNMGMPYNSPYDDYMLAIDEETGAGWFATDRNQLGDLVTIYVFVPAQVRVNLDVDREDLAERARISSVAATQPEGSDFSALLQRIEAISEPVLPGSDEPDFIFAFPDGRVYTRWDEFASPQARRLMETYCDALADQEQDVEALEELRARFTKGDREAEKAILSMEKRIKASKNTLKRLANQVVSAEMK